MKAIQQLPFIDYKKPVGNYYNYNFIKSRLPTLQAKLCGSHISRAGVRVKLKMLLPDL